MSAINQEPVLQAPGNVIHVEWDDNIQQYTNQVKDLLKKGDMLMVNYHAPIVYRWNKDTLSFMKMDLESETIKMWTHVGLGFNPIRALIDGSVQAYFVKASDLHYATNYSDNSAFYLKCEGEWFTIDYDDDRVFIKNNEAPLKSLYNVVTNNMVSIDHDYSWNYVFGSEETNPWLGWNTQEASDMDITLMDVEEQTQEQNVRADEYTPSVVGEAKEDEEVKDDYDEYDERREDIDGGWYTRRQFYDYYGSDDAWDNLDPSIYHQKRFDDHANCWVTEEECYQHYGTYRVWKRMHPIKIMKRKAIWDAFTLSRSIPEALRKDFIERMLETYE